MKAVFSYRFFLTLLLILLVLLTITACTSTTPAKPTTPTKPITPTPAYEKVTLSRFPIALDNLFRTDDPTLQQQFLAAIRNGRPEASMLRPTPYPNYFHMDHYPAALKWYLNANGHTAISLPLKCYLELQTDRGNRTSETINGLPCYVNLSVMLHISYYISILLDHACIAQSLINQYQSAGKIDVFSESLQAVEVAADTVIGYTHQSYALDFIVKDTTTTNFGAKAPDYYYQYWTNPYFYFTTAVQDQIRTYYQPQFDAMAQSGLYPESRLDRTFDINEAHSLFGCWWYKDGNLQIGENNHPFGWYSFNGCIVNILDVALTDHTTFYTDANTGLPFDSSMWGVYSDAQFTGSVPNYTPIGGKYMYWIAGTKTDGIIRLDNFFSNLRPGPIFMKYQLVEGDGSTIYDDLLYLDYFDSAVAASGPFTASKLTYIRIYEHTN
jgi:hypothetical protein